MQDSGYRRSGYRRSQNAHDGRPYVTVSLAILFAVASGLAVGNLYWAQPLLADIARDFGVATADTGSLISVTLVGYAIGVLFLVPLGDVVSRKLLIPLVMGASVVALALSAVAPGISFLTCTLTFVGLTTVSGQIIIPFTREASRPTEVGKMAGIVASGFTTGILLSRLVSGAIAAVAGWRAVFIVAAMLNAIMAFILARSIPRMPQHQSMSYPQLLASVVQTALRASGLAPLMVVNGLSFLAFNMFWTSVTFLLSGEPFGFSALQIGLVSLAGLAGALASTGIGVLLDRGYSTQGIGGMVALMFVAMLIALFGSTRLAVIVVAAALLSVASQGIGILCQTRVMGLVPGAESRLNTAFVVVNNIFSSMGSVLAVVLWNTGAWIAIAIGGAVIAIAALVAWFVKIRMT